MENFMGQLILDSEIDYESAREYIENKIRECVDTYSSCYFPKEYRQSSEWKGMDLTKKPSVVLGKLGDINIFIDFCWEKENYEL